jgi:Reverse transcriptase (RNA-dependent DNA polymerase)
MTQYSVKKGLKEFGQAGSDAVIKEMTQLDVREVMEPRMANMLTSEEKRRTLMYLMFLKKKRCGMIKARGCADGRKQRLYKSKEETSAPTVAVESLMLSCAIDAKERRHVISADIPGAFMQANIDEVVHMKLEGPLAQLLVKMNPAKYELYMTQENGKDVIYVMLKKALYGTLQAALLFWKDLSSKLIGWGYTLNPYDSCVANKIIDGKQCTILWHVDDIKVSHVDKRVIEQVIENLEAVYGKEAPLVVTRGGVHEYLGMTLDYATTPGACRISMFDYVEEMLDELPPDMDGEAITPAANHLFAVDDKATPLNADMAQFFHHNTAKLLFLSKRARPDIQTAVAFLTTRVTKPDEDDYKKLSRVMKYLRGSTQLTLVLEAGDLAVVKWWVDGSYAVHPDMRSHTGATMSLGKGSVYSTSIRQKLNTKSSTEAELVGVADVMPQVLWTRYFLAAQGYDVAASTIYQDNQSAILLEKNGRASSGKRTRHLNIRYFFVTDRIRSKEVTVEYCPTGIMRGDFFTKPLQGALFRKFRAEILNMHE